MIFLETTLTEYEKSLLNRYLEKNSGSISLVYAIEKRKLRGVTNPNKILFVGGLYLCEEKQDQNNWYMGQENDGLYEFWGSYGSLEEALEGL